MGLYDDETEWCFPVFGIISMIDPYHLSGKYLSLVKALKGRKIVHTAQYGS